MMDIVSLTDGFDLGLADTITPKAGNLLGVQVGDLSYAPTFGVDLAFYLTSNFKIQMETFKAYLVGQMILNQINVNDVVETVDTFSETLTWDVGDASEKTEGLIK
jgi:hypothetical protein